MYYRDLGPVPGQVEIVAGTSDSVVEYVQVNPEPRLTMSTLRRILGEDFIVTHYDWDMCLAEGGSAPLYRSESGPLRYFEYPHKGIAVTDDLRWIEYLDKPVGPLRSRCPERKKSGAPPSKRQRR